MDDHQFIASLVSSGAWPLVVAIVALVFRKQIGDLIGRLGHVKVGPLEAWAEEAAGVEIAVHAAAPAAPDKTSKAVARESLVKKLGDLAKKEPPYAVLAAWDEVQQALRQKVKEAGKREAPQTGLHTTLIAVQYALEDGVISEQTATAIRGLSRLQYMSYRGERDVDLETSMAFRFLALADEVILAIEQGKP